ncbi:MAG: DUF4190 domain-containing protein [Acidobacteriota bacterium]|nr:DUF4190 domain-containing protein [Acidobacteriota bacterium]
MKRCPTCQKTFADTMRFCQIDGTALVEDAAPPADPFKTVVSGTEDILSAMPPPADPFKTMVGGAPPLQKGEDDLLQLDEPDAMKTMINPGTFGKQEINFDQIKEDIKKDIPPPASSAPFSNPSPKDEQKSFGEIPQPPKFSEPNLNPPSFGGSAPQMSSPSAKPFENKPQKFDSNPLPDKQFSKSPFDNPSNPAIPSPFDLSMPPGYKPPSTPPFGEPSQPKRHEPTFSEPLAPKQNPFEEFQNPPVGQQIQQSEWTPPPAPEASWQNQNIGANTPFQPPAVAQGVNQTLPIISLVLGILSVCCYVSPVTGLAALITGYLGIRNASQDPNQYGGKGLAIAGMIVGGIFLVIGVLYYILVVFLGVIANLPR